MLCYGTDETKKQEEEKEGTFCRLWYHMVLLMLVCPALSLRVHASCARNAPCDLSFSLSPKFASHLTPHPSPLTPPTLTPHPSPLTPHPSPLTPHPSPLTPHQTSKVAPFLPTISIYSEYVSPRTLNSDTRSAKKINTDHKVNRNSTMIKNK